jgi:hypothetical protein
VLAEIGARDRIEAVIFAYDLGDPGRSCHGGRWVVDWITVRGSMQDVVLALLAKEPVGSGVGVQGLPVSAG